MTDKDNHQERETSQEHAGNGIKQLDIVLPHIDSQQELQAIYNLSPKKEAVYKTKAEQFSKCSSVIILTGMWGMGDSLISTRFAINMARQTGKRVICQVHPTLLAFAEALTKEIPNIQLVQTVDGEHIANRDTFVMRFLGGGGHIQDVDRWASGDATTNTLALAEKIALNRTLDLEELTVKEVGADETFPEPFAPVNKSMGTFNTSYYQAGYVSQTLGVPVTTADIRDCSIFVPTQEEVSEIAQDLEYVILPDAKEYPDEHDFRSYKSFDLRVWEIVFQQLPKDKKVGIVLGVSHPDYCQAVVSLAERSGCTVEVLRGDLGELALTLLRAKKIVGMDSGTTHLAKEVQTAAGKAGRTIALKALFNTAISHFEQYGIVEVESFTYQEETKKMAVQVADFIIS